MPAISFAAVVPDDFERLLALRTAVMRAHLERVGRYSPDLSRQRFAESFAPAHMRLVLVDGAEAGCVSLRPDGDRLILENFYLAAQVQGRGIGGAVLALLLAEADAAGRPVRLLVLKRSPAARFYERAGFRLVGEEPFDLVYERAVPVPLPSSSRRSTSASSLP